MKKQSQSDLLIIGLNYAPEITGIAPYTTGLARGLTERGHNVAVLTTRPHYPEWRVHPGYGGKVSRQTLDGVQLTRLPHYVPARPQGLRRLLSELSFGVRVIFAHWGKPKIVVLVSPALFSSALAILRARFSRQRPIVVVWIQDIYSLGITETGSGGGASARFVTWVERATLNAASSVVVIHPRFGEYLSAKLGIDPTRIGVVRNWTHLEAAAPVDVESVRAEHGWLSNETVILHAGNMGIKQALGNVVEAARLADEQQLPLRFVLLGNGSQRAALIAQGEGIARLQFIGSLDSIEFQAALAAADVLLVNEKRGVSEMAVPSKLTSYFNAGRPVIAATDRDGVTASEIFAAGGGVVVDSEQPQALVDAAMALGSDNERAGALGASGLRYRRDVLGEDVAIDRFAQWLGGLKSKGDHVDGRLKATSREGEKI